MLQRSMEPTDFIDVRSKIDELKLRQPNSVSILPYNLESASSASELLDPGSTSAVVKLLRTSDEVEFETLSEEPLPIRRDHDSTIVLPTLFFAACYVTQNPHAIAIALNVVGNYATQMLQGIPSGGRVRLSVVVEATKSKTVKKLDYEGPPSGLAEVARIAEAVHGKE